LTPPLETMNAEQPAQPLPETPLEALGPIVREQVILEGQTFSIDRPTETDRLLDHPFVKKSFEADEYLPYWADLWPASRMLAKVILRESWPAGLHALEIGCGLGLPGIAALAKGLRVTFSDYDATALQFAADNARINGFDNFDVLQMDWRQPPADLRVPLLLASDLIYELRNVEPLVRLIKHILLPDGLCLLTDQDRIPSESLRETLAAEAFEFTTQIVRAGEPGGRRVKGSLYRIRKAGGRGAASQSG
jgi:predicted nicotinamide N-methyase